MLVLPPEVDVVGEALVLLATLRESGIYVQMAMSKWYINAEMMS